MAQLTPDQAIEQANILKGYHQGERAQLDLVRRYWKGLQRLPAVIPSTAPREVREMARIARVNVCQIVIDSLAQSTFVDNFRTNDNAEDLEVWKIWQANKLDARQTGIHRATFAYGCAYAVVTPGDPYPVIRGVSPRAMTAMYAESLDWPAFALEYRWDRTWRLYDDNYIYFLSASNREDQFRFQSVSTHGAGVCPVIRYLDEDDLDMDHDVRADSAMAALNGLAIPTRGQIGPLLPVQDQIDLTTFGLLVAQWYSAFRQRWILGWTAEDEAQKLKASASQIWSFEDGPDEIKLGEFDQTDLKGYIDSREASLRHAATLSQTPVHELIGELVNLSAEALVAAEQGHERKVGERRGMLGESHEQTLRLAAKMSSQKMDIPEGAEVIWRDTSAQTLAGVVDALGKLSQMLSVPPQELWEKIPGVTKQDIDRWKAAAQTGDAFGQLEAILAKHAAPTQSEPAQAA